MENRVTKKKLSTSFRLHVPTCQFGNLDPFAASEAEVDLTGLSEDEANTLVDKVRDEQIKEVVDAVTRQKELIDQAAATLFVLQVEGIDPRKPDIKAEVMAKLLRDAATEAEKKLATSKK